MSRKLLTDGDSPPQTRDGFNVRDHSPLLDEDKFAFDGENFASTSLSSGQLGKRGNSVSSLYK